VCGLKERGETVNNKKGGRNAPGLRGNYSQTCEKDIRIGGRSPHEFKSLKYNTEIVSKTNKI
jgi:hypothetical protein